MNGPENYAEAERLIETARDWPVNAPADVANIIAAAQVHATLALAAATARPAIESYTGSQGSDDRQWTEATK